MKLLTSWKCILTSLIILAACSDDSDPAAPDDSGSKGEFMNCRITLIERENFSDHVFTYDNDGKLTSHVAGNTTYEYSYGANITTVKYYDSGELQRTETVTNNDKGFATNIKAEYENGITPTRYTTFEYDDKNQLVKKSVKNEGDTDEDHTIYQWMDGNMVSETDEDDDMTTYTYTSDLSQPSVWFNEMNLERGYVTILTKNRVHVITNPNGKTFTHSYNEDDDGRIESVTIAPANDDSYTKEYSYACE